MQLGIFRNFELKFDIDWDVCSLVLRTETHMEKRTVNCNLIVKWPRIQANETFKPLQAKNPHSHCKFSSQSLICNDTFSNPPKNWNIINLYFSHISIFQPLTMPFPHNPINLCLKYTTRKKRLSREKKMKISKIKEENYLNNLERWKSLGKMNIINVQFCFPLLLSLRHIIRINLFKLSHLTFLLCFTIFLGIS